MKFFNHVKLATWMLLIFILNWNLSSGQTIEVIAANLPGVNGLSLDVDGNLWVTQPGIVGVGGTVSVITPDKVLHTAIIGLPVYFDSIENETQGAWKAYHNETTLQVLVGGREHLGTGSLIIFDISNWKPGDNPLTLTDAREINNIAGYIISQGIKESDPYRLVWDVEGNAIIADAAANAIIKKDAKTGQFSVLHSFPSIPNTFTPFPPFIDYVPTGIVKNPLGGYYICNLTGFPFIQGLASIVKMDENGNVTPFVNGFTMLADLDIDAQGNLYALQLGQFDSTFNPIPFAAKVSKITPDGKISTYASGFTPVLSSGIALDGKGGCYVNDFAIGQVLHINSTTATNDNNSLQRMEMKLMPNPIHTSTKLEFKLKHSSEAQVSIYNTNGQLVYSQSLGILTPGLHFSSIDFNESSSGLFMLELKTNEGIGIQKITKQ